MDDQLDDPYRFKNMIMSKTPKVVSHEDFERVVYLAKQECRRCSFSSVYGPVPSPQPSTFHPSPRMHISPHPAFSKPLSMLQCTIPSPHPSLEKEHSSHTSTQNTKEFNPFPHRDTSKDISTDSCDGGEFYQATSKTDKINVSFPVVSISPFMFEPSPLIPLQAYSPIQMLNNSIEAISSPTPHLHRVTTSTPLPPAFQELDNDVDYVKVSVPSDQDSDLLIIDEIPGDSSSSDTTGEELKVNFKDLLTKNK